jgi:hypothetical protein
MDAVAAAAVTTSRGHGCGSSCPLSRCQCAVGVIVPGRGLRGRAPPGRCGLAAQDFDVVRRHLRLTIQLSQGRDEVLPAWSADSCHVVVTLERDLEVVAWHVERLGVECASIL